LFCHSTLNSNVLTDVIFIQTLWTFSMYLEGIALYPQTYLIKQNSRNLESFSTHFVAGMLGSRICSWIFWVFSFTELNTVYSKHTINLLEAFPGYFVFIFQCLNFYLTGDFFYYYVKSVILGSEFDLPLWGLVTNERSRK
jgi:ER lumen protein retaining receptor